MNYLNAKSAPAREDRLKTNIAFGGTHAKIKECLARDCFGNGEGCLNNVDRSFSQTYGCQFILSLAALNTLRNAVVIMHAPLGCGMCTVNFIGVNKMFKQLRDPNAESVIWLSTNLDEADVIGGGERKLREAVLYADKEFRPKTIVVANGCVPALIGDDIDSILGELQEQTAATLMPVHCEGFKTKVMATAYDAVYHGILKNYVRPLERERYVVGHELEEMERQYKISRNVNIMNVYSMSRPDELELERMLTAIGLNVRFIPSYADPDDFSYALETSVNVSVCATHDDYFVEHIKEKYNIPFHIDTIPIGRKNIARWVTGIAKKFDIEKEAWRFIAEEDRLLDESLGKYRKLLKGTKVFIAGGEVRIFATMEVLHDLGMEVVGLKAHHFDKYIGYTFDALENTEDIVVSVATNQPSEQVNLVKRLKPDILITHTGGNNIAAKLGVPIFPLFGQAYNYMGYSGIFEIARRINRILRNRQFNKNLTENTSLPYKKEWYDKDPFTYIKE